MRIVFMGTPEFARRCLEDLHQSRHEVVAVVTAPDRPAGRGKKLQGSAVKNYALEENIPLFQPEKLRDPEFLGSLKALQADMFVVVAFRMLPEVVWDMPLKGTINLHASLLPQYRGAAPIQWALINGEQKTGLTTFYINEHIDEGEILLQEEIEISHNMTAGELHDLMLQFSGPLIIRTLDGIAEGRLTAQAQRGNIKNLKMAPKIFREHGRIDWQKNAEEIHDLIRGLSPFPGAWSTVLNGDQELMLKIFLSGTDERSLEVGRIEVEGAKIYIGCGKGSIEILELQIPGRKRMKGADFLRGTPDFANWKIEIPESLI
jgi:methionyl-tRNA formyltransferase